MAKIATPDQGVEEEVTQEQSTTSAVSELARPDALTQEDSQFGERTDYGDVQAEFISPDGSIPETDMMDLINQSIPLVHQLKTIWHSTPIR